MIRPEHHTKTKTWNRSSALSPEDLGFLNTAAAEVMARAGVIKDELSLSDGQTREFYAMVIEQLNAAKDAFVQAKQNQVQ